MAETTSTEDKPAQPVRQPQTHAYTQPERTVIHLHDQVAMELADLRYQRDALNDQIRDLVPVEDRLRRMVAIIQRAYEDGDVGEAD